MPRSRGAARVLPFLMSMILVASLMAVNAPPARAAEHQPDGPRVRVHPGLQHAREHRYGEHRSPDRLGVLRKSGRTPTRHTRPDRVRQHRRHLQLRRRGNAERAFGGLRSGSLVPLIGAQFTNNTGGTITSLAMPTPASSGASARTPPGAPPTAWTSN